MATAAYFVWAACAFDFLDGFVARALHVSSPIGKELDSLADMVSFALSVPANACPLELAVINQLTTWTKPIIDYKQTQAK